MLRTGNRQIDERYQIIEEIHHGSNSIVYSAKDRKLSSYWAIKKIPKHNSAASTLMAEAEILTGLNHPALPRIRDIEEDNNSFYIIMDLVQGENLRTYLKLQHPIPQNLVVSWGIRLCDVLSYLHKNKIIYRDMKPSNIMMSKESKYNIKLIDFGIARVLKNPDMEDTTALGSFGYAAPEQYGDDAKTDERTDVYGLGVTLFQLLTGINPSRYDKEELNPRLERPDLSSGLSRVILKATNKDPDRRYQSAKEFKYALQHYQEYDTEYLEMKKMTIKKMMVFTITSVICFMISGSLFIGDKFETNRQYDSLISETQNAEALKNAITIKPSEPKAYVLLLESYGEELDDAGIAAIVAKQIKMRKDALADFEKAGRDDLVDSNDAEIAVLTEYMPKQLTAEEIADLVRETADEAGIQAGSGKASMGKLMGQVMPKVKGIADGNDVKKAVMAFLG